eukprot:CAMPEP_0117649556 /NCGR_PEP_ID=MMETSP0804-20121206/1039_1 /TAXON_ID=1074897 /ORGANISM="Tetraselmis astigmatica, Strain CCMP880" /LENGTH=198 /DNA_ID=CAMNT_0005455309 /DNA_START=587 /DNA_END=1183 /DNA_ORIENTATION=-
MLFVKLYHGRKATLLPAVALEPDPIVVLGTAPKAFPGWAIRILHTQLPPFIWHLDDLQPRSRVVRTVARVHILWCRFAQEFPSLFLGFPGLWIVSRVSGTPALHGARHVQAPRLMETRRQGGCVAVQGCASKDAARCGRCCHPHITKGAAAGSDCVATPRDDQGPDLGLVQGSGAASCSSKLEGPCSVLGGPCGMHAV